MARAEKTKMEKWMETRLMNDRKAGIRFEVDKVYAEVVELFRLNKKYLGQNNLKKKIKKVNRQVQVAFYREEKRITEMAKELMVTESVITRWVNMGFDLRMYKSSKMVIRMIRERDFIHEMKTEFNFKTVPQSVDVNFENYYLSLKRGG